MTGRASETMVTRLSTKAKPFHQLPRLLRCIEVLNVAFSLRGIIEVRSAGAWLVVTNATEKSASKARKEPFKVNRTLDAKHANNRASINHFRLRTLTSSLI